LAISDEDRHNPRLTSNEIEGARRMLAQLQGEKQRALELQKQLNEALTLVRDLASSLNALGSYTVLAARKVALQPSQDSCLHSVQAYAGATLTAYTVEVEQLGTPSVVQGQSGITAPAGQQASAIVLTDLGIREGNTAVQGQLLDVNPAGTLADLLDQIATLTQGDVQGHYDPGSDRVTLQSQTDTPLRLGMPGQTSNVWTQLRLVLAGPSSTASSQGRLKTLQADTLLGQLPLQTPVAPQGSFRLNGVTFTYDAQQQTLTELLAQVNDSPAGVNLRYHAAQDAMQLTSLTPGYLDIVLQDLTGNALAALGLSVAGATYTWGKPTLYTLNGKVQDPCAADSLTLEANPADRTQAAWVTAKAKGLGQATVSVNADTEPAQKALEGFIQKYNTWADWVAAKRNEALGALSTQLRQAIFRGGYPVLGHPGLKYSDFENPCTWPSANQAASTGHLQGLDGLGISLVNQKLSLLDTPKLQHCLTQHPKAVHRLLTDATYGLQPQIQALVEGWATHSHKALMEAQTQKIKQTEASLKKQEQARDDAIRQVKASMIQVQQAQAHMERSIGALGPSRSILSSGQ
jgi:flagellar capping protein FliD